MNFSIEEFLTNFLRNYTEPFSAKDLASTLCGLGYKTSVQEITEFLDTDARVFALEKKMYITRAGAFTKQIFSFVLTPAEYEQKVFVPGDRFMPFVDGEFFSFDIQFLFLGQRLKKKAFKTDSNTARDLFSLFGDEYSAQYIASDPCCSNLRIPENDFELPAKLELTGFSLEPFFKNFNFKPGDRILARVLDWNNSVVEIFPLLSHKFNPFQVNEQDFERQQWNDMLEKMLLESFERMGPCTGMEEQLANVFYENRKQLCVPECGSIREFLQQTKKIAMQLYGVETRLWKKGQDVPAVGKWNGNAYGFGGDGTLPLFILPDYIIDSFLKDQMFEKKENLEEIFKKLKPKATQYSDEERELLTLQIVNRNAILRKKYNWFADFEYGSIRHRALELYSRVGALVSEIDCADDEYESFPQQELVTLSQLYTHISRILEMLSRDTGCDVEGTAVMAMSLEGMEYNFEDIRPIITSAIDKVHRNRFAVI